MAQQNIYDDEIFFEGYKKIRDNKINANNLSNFWSAFWQMTVIFMVGNIFDRIFIDEFWVGHTKTWFIAGTEDLMPYIPVKVKIKKWIGNLIMFFMLSASMAGVVTFFTK